MKKESSKTTSIYVRVSPELKEKLRKASEKTHRSESEFIRYCIEKEIEKENV